MSVCTGRLVLYTAAILLLCHNFFICVKQGNAIFMLIIAILFGASCASISSNRCYLSLCLKLVYALM